MAINNKMFWAGKGFLSGSGVKNLPAKQETWEMWFDPWIGKIPWRRKWQPISVFLPGKSHGQRIPVIYSPWDHIESGMTELHVHTQLSRTDFPERV